MNPNWWEYTLLANFIFHGSFVRLMLCIVEWQHKFLNTSARQSLHGLVRTADLKLVFLSFVRLLSLKPLPMISPCHHSVSL